ncbi:ArsR/SmtB family transcription factor [Paenibacillus eucommiae]|uniref:DNA-binding transcriptional ArsR family regulator n=1 Tax=Paenibacillus eucommiae TaxID=1355755 RepID=A0ABS4J3A5_9BACL|nr:metalloregulator ArsR/SmtB family transcription factor [Paenibacillus eucommiae]MBP1994313.1 DNA-binding transcriptional ArsR family regulator [Paenibacillus eucommiae]
MEQDVNSPIMREFKHNQDVLVAIGNETRQAILITLAQETQDLGMRVGEIGRHTHLSRPAISHHLKILKDAGIVSVHKEGTKNFYRLNARNKMQDLRSLIDKILSLCE